MQLKKKESLPLPFLGANQNASKENTSELIDSVRDALYCSKICLIQSFQLMREAQQEYDWNLNFAEIAQIWRGGCIIRAAFYKR